MTQVGVKLFCLKNRACSKRSFQHLHNREKLRRHVTPFCLILQIDRSIEDTGSEFVPLLSREGSSKRRMIVMNRKKRMNGCCFLLCVLQTCLNECYGFFLW